MQHHSAAPESYTSAISPTVYMQYSQILTRISASLFGWPKADFNAIVDEEYALHL